MFSDEPPHDGLTLQDVYVLRRAVSYYVNRWVNTVQPDELRLKMLTDLDEALARVRRTHERQIEAALDWHREHSR